MKAFDTTTLGGRIATARMARKLTQAELAKLAGINQSSVALLESGSSKTSHNAVELAQALQVPVEWLLNGEASALSSDARDSESHEESHEESHDGIVITTPKSLDSFAERLAFLRDEHQLTQAQLAAKSGLSQATIGNLETGRNKGTKKILELAKALKITPEWLIQGGNLNQAKGAYLRKEMNVLSQEENRRAVLANLLNNAIMAPEVEDEPALQAHKTSSSPSRILPIISWCNEALSTPREAHLSDKTLGEFMSPFEQSPEAFWMKISDDVMEPAYLHDDLILVDPVITHQNNDDVVILDARDNSGFGRLRKTLSGTYLETFNPKYPNRMRLLDESVLIVGTVIGLVRQFRAMA